MNRVVDFLIFEIALEGARGCTLSRLFRSIKEELNHVQTVEYEEFIWNTVKKIRILDFYVDMGSDNGTDDNVDTDVHGITYENPTDTTNLYKLDYNDYIKHSTWEEIVESGFMDSLRIVAPAQHRLEILTHNGCEHVDALARKYTCTKYTCKPNKNKNKNKNKQTNKQTSKQT